jgi:hypothetical protein
VKNQKPNGQRFQNRKLNSCDHCGAKKQLSLQEGTNGRVYFLCQPATILLDLMIRDAAKAGFRI